MNFHFISFVATMALLGMGTSVHATELYQMHHNARALGMGGTAVSVVDNEEALFVNPAGIARFFGVAWTIADPGVAFSDPTSITKIMDLKEAAKFESTLNDLYGEPLYVGGSAKSAALFPFFGIGYYYDMGISFLAENPVNPSIQYNQITDKGYVIGTGWSVGQIFQQGFAIRYAERVGGRKSWGAGTIADIVAGASSPDVIFDAYSATGIGYALDYGMNLSFPGPVQPTLSFVWRDMGNTKYRAAQGEPAPPSEPQNMILGASVLVDMPFFHVLPAIEVRHLNDSEIEMTKKVHLGVEIGLPLINLRGGFYQGYYTYGAGLDLGMISVDYASWGTELGEYGGQYESRRYMVQISMGFGFDLGGGGGGGSGGKSGSAASGSGKSGGGKSGFFKTKKPKMRR